MIWGGDIETLPRESKQVFHLPMDVRIPPDAIFIALMTVVLVATVYLVLTRTRIGKAMRATADNPELALVSGIGVRGVTWWTWGIGAALAATAGVLLAVFQGQLLPIMGVEISDTRVFCGDSGRHRQPLRGIGGGLCHRRNVGSIHPMDEPQLQAGGSFRDDDCGAADTTQGSIHHGGLRALRREEAKWN